MVLFAAFGSLFAGYSLAVIVATLGQPTWYTSLNLEADPTAPGYSHTTTIIGAVNGVFFAAGFFGTLLSGWLDDRLGRVNSLRLAAAVGIVGAVLQTAAVNQGMVSDCFPNRTKIRTNSGSTCSHVSSLDSLQVNSCLPCLLIILK